MESSQTGDVAQETVAHSDTGRIVPFHHGWPRRHQVYLGTPHVQSRCVAPTVLFFFLFAHRCTVSLQYESKSTAGKAPCARGYHCALLADSRLFVFGGFNGHDVYDDVFVLDLAGAAYLPQVTSFKIDV
jgi:hypothetical protein